MIGILQSRAVCSLDLAVEHLAIEVGGRGRPENPVNQGSER
jgi:hypothetical protein